MTVNPWVESSVRSTLFETIRNHPSMKALIEELMASLPEELNEQAAKFEEWVVDAAMAELKTTIEHIDAVALANALLSNKGLQQKLAIPINLMCGEFSERIKSEIQSQIRNETQQIHNLLAARRAKERADRMRLLKRKDELMMQREVASAQGQLLWLRISSLSVAVPFLLIAMCLGALGGLNYPVNILCHKGDQVCQLRLGRFVER